LNDAVQILELYLPVDTVGGWRSNIHGIVEGECFSNVWYRTENGLICGYQWHQ